MKKKKQEDLSASILPLVKEIVRIRKQAKDLGLFTDDRELLECSNCDLIEDVTSDGRLITYYQNSGNINDCGLRFKELDEKTFKCPVCGTEIKVVPL